MSENLSDGQAFGEIPNGIFTILSPSGEHRTFSVRTQKSDARFAPGKRIVALLSGPDNTSHYQGFGFVVENGREIAVWRKKQQGGLPALANMLASMLLYGAESALYGKGYRLNGTARCLRCNRLLTTPESVAAGIGPVCAGRAA